MEEDAAQTGDALAAAECAGRTDGGRRRPTAGRRASVRVRREILRRLYGVYTGGDLGTMPTAIDTKGLRYPWPTACKIEGVSYQTRGHEEAGPLMDAVW